MTYRSGPPAPSASTIPPETSGSAPNGAEPRLPDDHTAWVDGVSWCCAGHVERFIAAIEARYASKRALGLNAPQLVYDIDMLASLARSGWKVGAE